MCVFVAKSRQPSNTFGGGSPHSWLVNTCSWHWPLDEAASPKSWHFTKPSSGRGLRKSGTLDKIKRHKESIRAILTFELYKGCGSWCWLIDQNFWSWHCNVGLPDIVSLCILAMPDIVSLFILTVTDIVSLCILVMPDILSLCILAVGRGDFGKFLKKLRPSGKWQR